MRKQRTAQVLGVLPVNIDDVGQLRVRVHFRWPEAVCSMRLLSACIACALFDPRGRVLAHCCHDCLCWGQAPSALQEELAASLQHDRTASVVVTLAISAYPETRAHTRTMCKQTLARRFVATWYASRRHGTFSIQAAVVAFVDMSPPPRLRFAQLPRCGPTPLTLHAVDGCFHLCDGRQAWRYVPPLQCFVPTTTSPRSALYLNVARALCCADGNGERVLARNPLEEGRHSTDRATWHADAVAYPCASPRTDSFAAIGAFTRAVELLCLRSEAQLWKCADIDDVLAVVDLLSPGEALQDPARFSGGVVAFWREGAVCLGRDCALAWHAEAASEAVFGPSVRVAYVDRGGYLVVGTAQCAQSWRVANPSLHPVHLTSAFSAAWDEVLVSCHSHLLASTWRPSSKPATVLRTQTALHLIPAQQPFMVCSSWDGVHHWHIPLPRQAMCCAALRNHCFVGTDAGVLRVNLCAGQIMDVFAPLRPVRLAALALSSGFALATVSVDNSAVVLTKRYAPSRATDTTALTRLTALSSPSKRNLGLAVDSSGTVAT